MKKLTRRGSVAAACALVGLAGCYEQPPKPVTAPPPVAPTPVPSELPPNTPGFVLTSPEFKEGGAIPASATCDGGDQSPELKWTGAPKGTKSFCLIVTDPDAPGGTFTHWLRINMPASTHGLPRGGSGLGLDGRNGFGKIAYGGPCPPSGEHHYRFTLYALNDGIGPSAAESRADVEREMEPHILGQTTLTGTYARR